MFVTNEVNVNEQMKTLMTKLDGEVNRESAKDGDWRPCWETESQHRESHQIESRQCHSLSHIMMSIVVII